MALELVRNDIRKMQVDAIVNTANPDPVYGSGTDKGIYEAAGIEKLLAARAKVGRIEPGNVGITPGFDLPCKYIIHAVSTPWKDGNSGEKEILTACYEKALLLAKKKKCKSIAFPLMAAGSYGFPKAQALSVAMKAIRKFLSNNDMMIYLVILGSESLVETEGLFGPLKAYIDDTYARRVFESEYEGGRNQSDRSSLFSDFNSCHVEADARIEDGFIGASPETDIDIGQSAFPTASYCFNDEPNELPEMPMHRMAAPVSASVKEKPARKKLEIKGVKKRSLKDAGLKVTAPFCDYLYELIDSRNLTFPQVYTAAIMSKQTFNKIINGKSIPKKKTIFVLALTLKLNIDETVDLLARAGYGFNPNSMEDKAVEFFIINGEYDMDYIDQEFIDNGLTPLIPEN